MKVIGLIVRALLASFAAAAGIAIILTRMQGDRDFLAVVLVIMLVVAPVCTLLFTIASLRPIRQQATRRLAVALTIVFGLVIGGMALVHFGAEGTASAAWPGIRRMLTLLASCATVVLVQWLIVRREPAPRQEAAMQFGRAGASITGGKK